MLTIGEFARLVGVSVRMLRHYDELGLLIPDRVDPHSGYRRYGVTQLERANRLVAWKDLGFSLDEVGRLLSSGSAGELEGMLRARAAALREQLDADSDRLRSVEARLRSIQRSEIVSTYVIANLPALQLVQLSARVEQMEQIESEVGPMFARVNERIEAAALERVGPGVAVYIPDGDGIVVVAGEQVAAGTVPAGLSARSVPAVERALTVRYEGEDLSGIQLAWQQLTTETERRELVRTAEGAREVYLQARPEDARWVVDLQQPVE